MTRSGSRGPGVDSARLWTLRRSALLALLPLALLTLACLAPPAHATHMRPPLPYRPKEFAFIFDGDRFHLFYMRHNMDLPDDSTEQDIGHATSFDLIHWHQLDPILPIRPDSWDNLHVWSPTIVKSETTWYMFYAGVTYQPGAYALFQRIGLATSSDLMNWTRIDPPVLGCPQIPWVYCDSTVTDGGDFRDPFVMPDPATPGSWLMIYATRPDAVRDQMVAGVAKSSGDLTQWTDRMPMWNTDLLHSFSPLIESPAMFEHDGLWYLFYTTNSGHPINFETSLDPTADSTGWSNQMHLSTEVTEETDFWFGPELLSVGGHDYFCAVNSETFSVEIREIVWGIPPHFDLMEPSTAGLGVGDPALPGALELRLARGLSGRSRWSFEILSPAPAHVRLDLLDVGGRHVAQLAEREVGSGTTEVEWSGLNQSNQRVASGVYFVRLRSGNSTRTLRLAVVR